MDDVFGGIDDTLRQIARIAYDHCALALPAKSRHRQIIIVILVLMLLWILVVVILLSGVPAAVSPAHSRRPARRSARPLPRCRHVDAEAGVHEQVAVLLLQEIGFRFQLAAQTAPAEHRHLVASPSL